MGTMMNGDMACGMAMTLGMGIVAIALLATLALTAAAAIKYLRSGGTGTPRALTPAPTTGDR